MQNKDIVIVGLQPWDIEIGSNCKNIARELARNNRVLYINPPTDRVTFLKDRRKERIKKRKLIRAGKLPALVEIADGFWEFYPRQLIESINSLPDGKIFDYLNKRNGKVFASEINAIRQQLGFRDIILFNDNSIYLGQYLKELLSPSIYIYYIRDFLINNPYWKKHGLRIEPELIKKADLVVANSDLYAEYGKRYNKYSFMVGQGCDVSNFNESIGNISIADELSGIPRPIVGYTGYLSSRRLDIELIRFLAESNQEMSFVFVGPEDAVFNESDLHKYPNIYFLGHKEEKTLPSFIKGFDVTINPQLLNKATAGNYPRKIDEYLAMGKPVVARHTMAMNYFKEVTYLAKEFVQFSEMLSLALKENSEEKSRIRKAVAQSHSWQNNVKNICQCIELVYQETK